MLYQLSYLATAGCADRRAGTHNYIKTSIRWRTALNASSDSYVLLLTAFLLPESTLVPPTTKAAAARPISAPPMTSSG
jgi:hypothetical protein